jgi:hypothetical protein
MDNVQNCDSYSTNNQFHEWCWWPSSCNSYDTVTTETIQVAWTAHIMWIPFIGDKSCVPTHSHLKSRREPFIQALTTLNTAVFFSLVPLPAIWVVEKCLMSQASLFCECRGSLVKHVDALSTWRGSCSLLQCPWTRFVFLSRVCNLSLELPL